MVISKLLEKSILSLRDVSRCLYLYLYIVTLYIVYLYGKTKLAEVQNVSITYSRALAGVKSADS